VVLFVLRPTGARVHNLEAESFSAPRLKLVIFGEMGLNCPAGLSRA
jgi:hypothetical protein